MDKPYKFKWKAMLHGPDACEPVEAGFVVREYLDKFLREFESNLVLPYTIDWDDIRSSYVSKGRGLLQSVERALVYILSGHRATVEAVEVVDDVLGSAMARFYVRDPVHSWSFLVDVHTSAEVTVGDVSCWQKIKSFITRKPIKVTFDHHIFKAVDIWVNPDTYLTTTIAEAVRYKQESSSFHEKLFGLHRNQDRGFYNKEDYYARKHYFNRPM